MAYEKCQRPSEVCLDGKANATTHQIRQRPAAINSPSWTIHMIVVSFLSSRGVTKPKRSWFAKIPGRFFRCIKATFMSLTTEFFTQEGQPKTKEKT